MNIKTAGLVILVIVLLVLTATTTQKVVSAQYSSEIVRLKAEAEIYKRQADNYARTLRSIRETATTAAPMEKAL